MFPISEIETVSEDQQGGFGISSSHGLHRTVSGSFTSNRGEWSNYPTGQGRWDSGSSQQSCGDSSDSRSDGESGIDLTK